MARPTGNIHVHAWHLLFLPAVCDVETKRRGSPERPAVHGGASIARAVRGAATAINSLRADNGRGAAEHVPPGRQREPSALHRILPAGLLDRIVRKFNQTPNRSG